MYIVIKRHGVYQDIYKFEIKKIKTFHTNDAAYNNSFIVLSITKQKLNISNEDRVDEGYVACNEQK